MLDKKGFLFTVTVFLILVYILLSISVWVKSIEASERTFSEFYKESTVELTMEQITPAKMANISRVILNRNLVRLNEYSVEHTVLPGPAGDELAHVRGAMGELLAEGNASGSHFRGGESLGAEGNSSLRAWVNNLNASLRAIGVYVSEYNVTHFAFGQEDIDNVNYSFELHLGLKDFTNTSTVSRTYLINNTIGISGIVDPALRRASAVAAGDESEIKTVYRQFFFRKDLYPDSSSISVSRIPQTVSGGQGWLYGPLAAAGSPVGNVPLATTIPIGDRQGYILTGTFSEIEALGPSVYQDFGAYIVTTRPVLSASACGEDGDGEGHSDESNTFNPLQYVGENCSLAYRPEAGIMTEKPYIIAENFNAASAHTCPMLNNFSQTGRCALMLNPYLESQVASSPLLKYSTSGSGLFNVEGIRDFVMCGYYTHNPAAPSYLQRLLDDPYSRNSTQFGIETFVIGTYASDYGIYDTNSRLDRELFDGDIHGIKIRGLPGCKNFNSCSDSPMTGIFAVSGTAAADYGLGDAACNNGAAGCG
jgi:hypothetical protein